jgi:hypothetical protein
MQVCDVCMLPGELGHAKLKWEGFVADDPPRGRGEREELTLCRIDQDMFELGNWSALGLRYMEALNRIKET